MSKTLEKIKWLRDVFVTRKEEQHFEIDILIKTSFDEAISDLKAKDKEIERLRTILMQSNYESVLIGNKIGKNKARSIVAMLFWDWKQTQRWIGKNHFACKSSEDAFKKAYAMIKDNK